MDAEFTSALPPDVELAIRESLGPDVDELDAPDFDAVDYINNHFPNEDALDGLEAFILQHDRKLNQLDENIYHTVCCCDIASYSLFDLLRFVYKALLKPKQLVNYRKRKIQLL